SKEAPNRGNSRVIVTGPSWPGIRFSVGTHGPELVAVEYFAITPDAVLLIEDGAPRTQLDGQGNKRDQWQTQQQARNRNQHRREAFVKQKKSRDVKARRKKEPAQPQ